jgi:hypothetical protein
MSTNSSTPLKASTRRILRLHLKSPENALITVVKTPLQCPNLYCTLALSHTHFDHSRLTPCPQGIQRLTLRRFHPDINPLPNTNAWEVAARPRPGLADGMEVYVANPRLGVVTLKSTVPNRVGGWRVFKCLDKEGIMVLAIVVKEEWCKRGPGGWPLRRINTY